MTMSTEALQEHIIRLKNLVWGEAWLFTLFLPEGWELRRGFAHPELHAALPRNDRYWVTSADIHYLLGHTDAPWLAEFAIRVRPTAFRMSDAARTVRVFGHPAQILEETVRRGPPWRRYTARQLTLTWYCPESNRHFRLQIVGALPDEAWQALRQALMHTRCHL